MNKRFLRAAILWLLLMAGFPLFAQDLSVKGGDLRIEQRGDDGLHLFIRKKPEIGSVLLTESTRDTDGQSESYAYRAPEWNAINGDEVRLLNGTPISRTSRIYSLIDSTPENHPELGPAFHIFIPPVLRYGYAGGRHGEIEVANGTYFNIRAFALPHADYRGGYKDNPFILNRKQSKPAEPPPPPIIAEPRIETRPPPQITVPPVIVAPPPESAAALPEVAAVPPASAAAPSEPVNPPDEYFPIENVSEPPKFDEREIIAAIEYPVMASLAAVEGQAILELLVDRNGLVQQIRIVQESPPLWGFGAAAVKAFTGRQGTPAQVNGKPVPCRYRYPVTFRL
jgi:TonB family protein